MIFEGIAFPEQSVWLPALYCLKSQILMYPRLALALKSQCAVGEPDAPAFNENSQPHFLLTRHVSQSLTSFAERAVIGDVSMCPAASQWPVYHVNF
jgi:hypothetical protein